MTDEEAKQQQDFTSPRKMMRAQAKRVSNQTTSPRSAPVNKENTHGHGINLHFLKSILTESHIQETFEEIKSDRVAKLIGLCSHFVYWAVLGNFNNLPLDDYHMKQLFISMLQCVSAIELDFLKNRKMRAKFVNFVMPMIILTIRVEMEVIFKMNYRAFLANKSQTGNTLPENEEDLIHQALCMRLINGVITEIFDPNIFYSRLSFLESGKDALDIKNNLNQGRVHNGFKLPNLKNKFYTRSALIKNLIPMPSEGKIRSKFSENREIIYPKPS